MKLLLSLALTAALFSAPAFAQAPGSTGLGVVIGSPNGLTGRHWINEESSIEGSLGWALSGSRFQVNVNYLFNKMNLIPIGDESLDLFFGGGLSLRTKSGKQDGEVVFGPRVPVGVSYTFANPNLEVFAQVALNIGIIPSSDIYADGNLGARFYF
ncbi:MAG: hypothetical protein EOP11_07695 [Proteobacteria bacterium]|nr:MAG: hypothetical protein EOP11_07695 [Pseudomonadota bacterium]